MARLVAGTEEAFVRSSMAHGSVRAGEEKMMQSEQGQGAMNRDMMRKHYRMLGLNLLASGIVMYLAMFTMIWSIGEFYNNLNMIYMTLIMLAPMAILMLLMMGMMYQDRRLNLILYAVFTVVFILSFFAMRDQSAIGDRQFLRSMIPHHSGAILMCRRAAFKDPEIRRLCFGPNGIVDSQQREISQMENLLRK